jgi:hypothetical protein
VSAAILPFASKPPQPRNPENAGWAEDFRFVDAICVYAEGVAVAVKSGPLPTIDRAILQSFRDLLEAAESQI